MSNLIKCNDCGKKVSINASTCPNCGAPVIAPLESANKKSKNTKYAIIGLIILFLLSLALCSSDPDKKTTEPEQITSNEAVENTNTDNAALSIEAETEGSKLTNQQRNAVRAAKNYTSLMGFSRDGLINQLSSDAGDGYSIEDATIAIDSMGIDWNEQAVKSAKNYLSIQGFSCNGLIEQLSSSAGDKYTKEQAEYGAKAAGACD